MHEGSAMRGIQLLLALLRADVYGSGAFGPDVARAARRLAASGRVALRAGGMGVIGFALGFFGPRWLGPGTNQGPLPGIVLGLLGLLGGLAWGLWRERGRRSSRDAT
jgi:hypothetical protein